MDDVPGMTTTVPLEVVVFVLLVLFDDVFGACVCGMFGEGVSATVGPVIHANFDFESVTRYGLKDGAAVGAAVGLCVSTALFLMERVGPVADRVSDIS